MKRMIRELRNRLRLWFEKDKRCRHCCLVCEYYDMCKNEELMEV